MRQTTVTVQYADGERQTFPVPGEGSDALILASSLARQYAVSWGVARTYVRSDGDTVTTFRHDGSIQS